MPGFSPVADADGREQPGDVPAADDPPAGRPGGAAGHLPQHTKTVSPSSLVPLPQHTQTVSPGSLVHLPQHTQTVSPCSLVHLPQHTQTVSPGTVNMYLNTHKV